MTKDLKDRVAVAVRYEAAEDIAPRLTAKGQGYVAEEIVRLARQHGIPLHHDPDLVELLSQLEMEQAIPPEAYEVVAEILAFVYTLNEHRKQMNA